MSKIFLSIVIPSYNEVENLKRGVLTEVENYLSKQNYTWEVIVSDDGSSETMARELAKRFCQAHKGFLFLENSHAGKPFAVWEGIKKAQGDIVLFTDMDQSTPLVEIEKLLPYFSKGYDVVIGSRGFGRKNFSFFRQLASAVFREIRRAFLLRDIVDTQCGFKAFRLQIANEVFPLIQSIREGPKAIRGWKVTSFDVELLVAAESRGYKISEVPVEWEDRDASKGKSRGLRKFVKESVDMLKEIYRVKQNLNKGDYTK